MNWNPFKKTVKPAKAEKPKTDFQKALDANEAQKAYKPNRQIRRLTNRVNGDKYLGRKMP